MLIGETLDKYQIIEHLGHGGMADVYKGYQPNLDRHVAVKVLHTFLASEENFLTRFQREAKAVAALRHPNIVQVYDFDYDEDRTLYYMVMEFIDGQTLKAKLKELAERNEHMPLEDAIPIAISIGKALDYAHKQGMVHRDIKPANIMFNNEGEVILTDFGIAKMISLHGLTASGEMMGTPAYISPELGTGEAADERSDIYSLAVVLYELVTGTRPFEAENPIGIVLKHIREPVPLPSEIQPDIPVELEHVLLQALEKEPAQRYQSAGAFVEDLQRVTLGQAVEATPTGERTEEAKELSAQKTPSTPVLSASPTPTPTPEALMRNRGWAAALIAVILLVLGTAGGLAASGQLDNVLTDVGLIPPTATIEGMPTPDSAATEMAATLVALQATVGAPTSTPTSTPTPTPTGRPTPDLTATFIAVCVFDAEIVDDDPITPRILTPDQRIVKRWEVRNSGTCTWPEDVELVFVSGDEPEIIGMSRIMPLAPGETTEIEVTLRAAGDYRTYTSNWQLQDESGDSIGETLRMSYRVGPTPTPWPTETPTATPTPQITPTPSEPLWMAVPGLVECQGNSGGLVTWGSGGGSEGSHRYFYSQVAPEYELGGPYNEFEGFPHVVTYFTTSGELSFPVPDECGEGNYGQCGGPEMGFEIVWRKVSYQSGDCPSD